MELFLLEHLSSTWLAVLSVAAWMFLAVGGMLLVRRSVALRTLESHNDVAGFIIAVVGVVYAVMLAFTVVVIWEQFDAADAQADTEAHIAVELYRDAFAFPDHAAGIQAQIRAYVRSVIRHEWPVMSAAGPDARTDAAVDALWRAYEFEPAGERQRAFFEDSVGKLDDLLAARQDRLSAAGRGLPGPVWFVLIFGGIVTIGFTYFFGVSNIRAQLLMTCALAASIAAVIFLVLTLDLPYSGDVGVDPDALERALRSFDGMHALRP